MKDKSPLIVKTATEYLQTAVKQTYIDDLNKIYPSICAESAKLANHQDGEVRDIGLATLGLFKARVGAGIDKYLGDLNPQKLEKVNEAAAAVKLTKYDKPKQQKKKPAAKKEEKKTEEDGDGLMSFDGAAPKKAKAKGPPASFFKRQQEMQDKAQEKFEELKAELKGDAPPPKKEKIEEEKKAPPKAASNPPPAAKPKAAAPAKSSGPAKTGGKKPKVQVEDTGPGVAKEDAENIMNEKAPGDILKQFEESKWQDKKEAYTKLAAWLLEQEYSNELYEATFWFIKIKMKEWKEKNVNIVKAALQCICDIIKDSQAMSKRAATIIIPFLSESIGDVKYKEMCKESLLSLAELLGPGFVIKYMCK